MDGLLGRSQINVLFAGHEKNLQVGSYFLELDGELYARGVRKIKIQKSDIRRSGAKLLQSGCACARRTYVVAGILENICGGIQNIGVIIDDQDGNGHTSAAFSSDRGAYGLKRHLGTGDLVFDGVGEGRDGFARARAKVHEDARGAAAHIRIFVFLDETDHGMHHVRIKEPGQTQDIFGAAGRVLIAPQVADQKGDGHAVC